MSQKTSSNRLVFECVALLVMSSLFVDVLAQGTFTIRFSELPPGQVLAEQYASQGVHFFGGFNQPLTATAPAFLSPSGQTVGVARNVLGMRFDYAISSISIRIAQQASDLSSPNLSIAAWDSQGTVVSHQGTAFPPNQWADVNLSFGANQDVRRVAIEGFNLPPIGQNNTYGFYIDTLGITAVPEPSLVSLFGAGILGFLLCRRKRFYGRVNP